MSAVTASISQTWNMTNLPSETLGLIGELAGIEAVSRLLCCGCRSLSNRLMSSSGIGRMDIIRYARQCTLWFPRFASSMMGLKTLNLKANHFNGIFASVQRDVLLTLPSTLEKIAFWFVNAELCWLANYTYNEEGYIDSFKNPLPFPFHKVFPKLHTLQLNGNMRQMHIMSKKRRAWCWRALLAPGNFPSTLLHLTLASCNRIPIIALAQLPTTLEYLRLASASGTFLGSWLPRLSALRTLIIPIWPLKPNGDGFVYLPNSLLDLKVGGLQQKDQSNQNFLFSSISQLPRSLTSFMMLHELDSASLTALPSKLTKLDMAMSHMTLPDVSNLPRTLTHLCVRLNILLPSEGFAFLPPSLKTLELPQYGLDLSDLELMPRNLTSLKALALHEYYIGTQLSSQDLIQRVPPNLKEIIFTNMTWNEEALIWKFKPKSLTYLEYHSYKSVMKWWKLNNPNMPWFEKMDGWTSIDLVVANDAPEILETLLLLGYELYGCLQDKLLESAVKNGSLKILEWLDRNGFDMAWNAGDYPSFILRHAIASGNPLILNKVLLKWDIWFPDGIERSVGDDLDGYDEHVLSEDESSHLEEFDVHSTASSPSPISPEPRIWIELLGETTDSQNSVMPRWPEDGFWDGRRRLAQVHRPQNSDPYWCDAVKEAVERGRIEVLEWLDKRDKAKLFETFSIASRQSIIRAAAQNKNWDSVKWLYEHSFAEIDLGVLEHALRSKSLEMLEWMKRKGISITSLLKMGSKDKIRDWILVGSLPILKWLKQEGCQIGPTSGLAHFLCTYLPSPYIADWLFHTFHVPFNEPDPSDAVFRYFPVHIVARAGNLSMLKWLRHIGVNMNAKDAKGNTAADIARSKGKTQIYEFLTEKPQSSASSQNTDPSPNA